MLTLFVMKGKLPLDNPKRRENVWLLLPHKNERNGNAPVKRRAGCRFNNHYF
jgi:hypothetical protein